MRHDGGVLEGRLADQELVHQHAQAPQVDLLGVPVVLAAGLDHLWREVVEGAAERVAAVVGRVHAPAEIRDLDLAVDAHQDVLGLDVAVDDVLAVQVAQRRRHLRDVLRGLPLGEPALAPQVLVQLALAGELEDQKDALAVVKVPVQLEDVGVPQVALDLDLAPHLLLDARPLLQLRLVEHLERADEARAAVPRQIHAPELALAERPANLEHAEVELLGHERLVHERVALGRLVGRAGRQRCRLLLVLPRRGRVAWCRGALPLRCLGGKGDGCGDGVGAL